MAKTLLKTMLSKKMLITYLQGFSCGIPFIMIGSTLKTWLAEAGIDIGTIGFFAWVSMFYSFKVLWAPILDRYNLLPLGRRRSWMLITQSLILLLMSILGTFNPATQIGTMAVVALMINFLSATQDIAVDAYRREILSDEELGIGSTVYQYGYRTAIWVGGGLFLVLADASYLGLTWKQTYLLAALCMLPGILTSLVVSEPTASKGTPVKSLVDAYVNPFKDFLKRHGAILILLFVFFFKLGDAMSGSNLNPFYIQMGYQKADIGLIAKTFGMFSVMAGLLFGGIAIFYIGIYRSLWIFGILQALSTASFAIITYTGPKLWALAFAVVFEDISSGMGSAAFIAFLSKLTNVKYTATQFALLSSIATIGRNVISGTAGKLIAFLGWELFYYSCALLAIPGLFLLYKLKKYEKELG